MGADGFLRPNTSQMVLWINTKLDWWRKLQIEGGLDYQETFAPVAKMIIIRVVIALAAQFKWELHQMDVKSAFLNGNLTEEVYMEQPPGFQVKGKETLVCRLKKALYGLK